MKNRIKELMKQKGMSRDTLAEKIDVHPITISKLISGKIGLNLDKIEKLAAAFEVTPSAVIGDVQQVDMRPVNVVAFVQAGNWAESNELPQDDQYSVAVPKDPVLDAFSLTGVEVRGPSMNLRYPEGTVLVITNAIETQEDIQLGKRYVVERQGADGMLECTVKTLHKDEDGQFWLMPESSDPRHQQPIEVNGSMGDTIRILGRVTYSLLREE